MTTIAAMREALASLGGAAGDAADAFAEADRRTGAEAFPELPPATAPYGPQAAREVAQEIADNGHHSHLHAHGETVCLSGACTTGNNTLEGLL